MIEVQLPSSPYTGLRPFAERDAEIFFGREKETRVVTANLRTRKLTLLYGPTGVGKSSLLGAGVLNHLKSLNKEAAPVDIARAGVPPNARINLAGGFPDADEYDTPVVALIFTDWIAEPLQSLQQAILTALQQSLPKVFTDEKNQELRGLGLAKMLKEIAALRDVELLIILDQFERYFVYRPIEDENSSKFDDEFCLAVSSRDVHASFLISIREDWLARLDRFKGRISNLFETAIRVNHLDRESAKAAITKPIERYNELLAEHRGEPGFDRPKVEIDEEAFVPELLNQLQNLDETNHLPSGASFANKQLEDKQRRIQASNLQIVLRNLWEKIKDDPVPTLGFDLVRNPDTAKQIIQSNLERTLEQLSPEETSLAADLFRFMVTTSGAKLAETADGLANQTGRSPEETEVLLNKLCGRKFRILSEVQPPPDQSRHNLRYELTSDTLANPIREWIGDIRAEKRRRKAKRNYLLVMGGLCVVFIILFLLYAWGKARKERRLANEQARLLQKEKANYERELLAIRGLDEQVPYSQAVLRGHGARVTSAAFTPNGGVLTASADGSAILWNLETRNPIREFRNGDSPLICAAINPAGDRIVTASVDGRVLLWTVASQDVVSLRAPQPNHITGVSFSKDGDLIAGATTAGAVIIWDANRFAVVRLVPANGAPIRQLVFSPSGKRLAAAFDDATVRVWQTVDWDHPIVLVGHVGKVNSVAFSPDEQFIASTGADATVRVWDLSTGQAIRVLMGHAQSVNSVAFSNDGKRLLTASDDTTARLWTIETSKSLALVGHTDKVLSSSLSPSSQQVVTGSKDGVVRIWSAKTGLSMVEFRGHIAQVNYVVYSKDGKYVLSAGEDATARVWFATDSGGFRIDQPTIVAIPPAWYGPCPVTISFLARVIALSGSGKVTYKFIASDGRAWFRELAFDEPNTQDINWYWRIEKSYRGFQTIEVLDPKGTTPQTARFSVKCVNETTPPVEPPPAVSPIPTVTPVNNPSPNRAPQ